MTSTRHAASLADRPWLLLVLGATIAAGATGRAQGTAPPAARATATLAPAATPLPPGFDAEVIEVMDGDRLILRKAGERDLVALQMIGIDAPQVSTRERAGQEPFGTMALQFLSVAITRKVVRVEQDVQRSSEGGDQMGYVWSGDKLMNEEMLRAGLAVVATVPPNVKYVERLMRAQADARTAKRGIWYPEAPLPQSPSEFRAAGREASEKQARAESAVELPGFQEGCAIGNRQTKKFHLPGGRYYEKAKTSKNAVFFSSGADAERAGYVQSAH